MHDVCAYGRVLVEEAHGCQCVCTEVQLLGVTFCLARLACLLAGFVSWAKWPWASIGSFICPAHVSCSVWLLRIWTQGSDWPGKRFTHWFISWDQSKLYFEINCKKESTTLQLWFLKLIVLWRGRLKSQVNLMSWRASTLRRLLLSRCYPQDLSYTL